MLLRFEYKIKTDLKITNDLSIIYFCNNIAELRLALHNRKYYIDNKTLGAWGWQWLES